MTVLKKALSLLLALLMVLSCTAVFAEEGEYYNTYMAADPTSMDISRVSDSYSNSMIANVMECLVRMGEEDGHYVYNPGDAQSWEHSEDGLVWTFHLGNNCWSDGQPVTAQDYVYSLRRSVDPNTGSPNAWFFFPIAGYDEIVNGASVETFGVKALDDKTLEITLVYPMPSFLDMVSGTVFYPQRQDIVEQYGDQYGTEADKCIYNGPYVLDSWTHNSKLVLKKNPYYWGAADVRIETVNVNIMSDANTRLVAFETGDLDWVGTSATEWVDKFASLGNTTFIHEPTASLEFAFFNTRDQLFGNANIRKAFTLALDREDANELCFNGSCVPTYGWICPALGVGSLNFRENVGETILDMQAEMAAEGKTAKDYLLKGMEELGLGTDPSKLKIVFSFGGTGDWFRTFGEYLQQTFKSELGVNMELAFYDWGVFSSNLSTGNYQIGYMSWGAYYNDPYDMLSLFYSDWDSIGTGWANAQYDELVTSALKEQDDAKRLELYKQAEDILIREECVACPVITAATNGFYYNYVTDYETLNFSMTGYKGMSTGGR